MTPARLVLLAFAYLWMSIAAGTVLLMDTPGLQYQLPLLRSIWHQRPTAGWIKVPLPYPAVRQYANPVPSHVYPWRPSPV